MALNKFMHPRNIYKNPPDFAKLAKTYEDFSSIVKVDITGKVTIDFKDPHSLRVLTKCLLKSDFNLDVFIPEDRLVPTLPLRLNYILWIEDLLNSIQRNDNVWGIDIGTGACAIYPLLGAAKNKWHMVGTETDQQSLLKAQENVLKNNLQELIEVRRNETASVLEHMFDKENVQNYDFCMCNPPFYSNMEELYESRSPARLPPKNGFTGSPQELITEGGELAFCRKMIKESHDYKDRIIIFTTMVGHKYNMRELVQDLKEAGVHHTTTEFCQGRVTRWGLAWTYQSYDLSALVPSRDKPRKKSLPISYLLPELPNITYDLDTVSKKIKSIFEDLKIDYKVLNKRGNNLTMDIKASTNTWSNQRRKRRLMKTFETNVVMKKPKLDETTKTATTTITTDTTTITDVSIRKEEKQEELRRNVKLENAASISINEEESKKILNVETNATVNSKIIQLEDKTGNSVSDMNLGNCGNVDSGIGNNNKDNVESTCSANANELDEAVVHAFLKLMKKDKQIILEMEFLDGSAGKEGLHQIVQYIKNHWK